MTRADWPLVGRSRQLVEVADALADPDTTGIVITGDAGVGKTRLARHAVTVARDAGFAEATVRATTAASTIPLGAFAPLVGDAGSGSAAALDAARRAVGDRSGGAPLLLLVDDAHALDPASATLLLQLAADETTFVVATVRSGEPVPDAVTALWKDAGARRIGLQPLAAGAVTDLLEDVLGGPVAIPARQRFTTLSGGNPLALRELVTATLASGALCRHQDVWHLDGEVSVSERLQDLVGARISSLSDDERDGLITIALGEPLPLVVAEPLLGTTVLQALEDRQLVAVDDGDGDGHRLSLAHPLYGEVGVHAVGMLHRRGLLTALADATAAHGLRDGTTAMRIATWRLGAGEHDPLVMLEGARAAYAAEDLDLTAELTGAVWRARRCAESGHLLGLALGRLARSSEAEDVLAAATELTTDDRERVLLALARSENLFRGLDRADDALTCVVEAEAQVADDAWRAELVAHRAMLLLQQGQPGAALALVEPLLHEDTPDRPFVKAAYAAGPALANDGRTDEATALARRALPIHEQVWNEDLFQTEPAVHHVTAIVALVESGALLEAEAYADLAVQVAADRGADYGLAHMSMLAGLVALRRGHVAAGRRHCLEAIPLFDRTGFPGPGRWVHAGVAIADALLGDLPSARRHLDQVDELAGRTLVRFNEGVIDEARGWALVAEGAFDAARESLSDAADRALQRGERAAAGHLLHTVTRLGAPELAIDRLADLATALDGDLPAARHAHARALVEDDGPGLDAVSETFERCGADLWAAESAADAVRAHRRSGDQRAATRAHRRVTELGGRCQGAHTPALVLADTPVPLTNREREVAILAAEGRSSKDIAEHLVLSPRTVDNHLQRIFAKLGVERRSELASALRDRPAQ